LKPKLANFKTASIQYRWEIIASGQGDDQVFNLGLGPDNYTLFWGTGQTADSVNGFPVLGTVPPYTPELGLAAVSFMWSFCSATTTPLVPDPGSACATYEDTSSFCVVYPELGASFYSVGAFRSTIYSERHIDSPLFAKFAIYQPAGTPYWRGWHKAGLGAGSASMIGPQIIDLKSDKLLMRNKIAPTVKVYNFYEVFEQLSLTVCLAYELINNSAGQNAQPCPLTSQQVQVLLRQNLLPFFDNEMFQDLRYDTPDKIHLLPFVVGPNGSMTQTSAMLVPTFLAENIRAMKALSAVGSKKYYNSVISWYSVLARPAPTEYPQLGNYHAGPSQVPIYAVNPSEIAINIIDASAPFNQGLA